MQTTKTIFFAITVVLLSLLATSCIPTTPGGNPTPTNTFNIGATYRADVSNLNPPMEGIEKIVIVDGDTLSFKMSLNTYATCWSCIALGYACNININDTPLAGNTLGYSILVSTYSVDFSNNYYGKLFNDGFTIDDNYTDSISSFIIPVFNNSILLLDVESSPDSYRFPMNINKYIVLRKAKPAGNQYYWIKFRKEGTIPYLDETIIAVSGKYQMNSITTGQ